VLVRTVSGRQGTTLAGRVGAGPEWAMVGIALAGLGLAVLRRRRNGRTARDQSVPVTEENG